MKVSSKLWRWLGVGLLVLIVAFVVVRTWVVPAVIVGQIRNQYGGHVAIQSWWLGGSSAGVSGLELHEGPSADSPVWARIGKVGTDLSLGDLLSGRFAPKTVTIRKPELSFRIAEDGHPLTQIPLQSSGEKQPLPDIRVEDARLSIEQEMPGKPRSMVVNGIDAQIDSGPDALALSAETDDPNWGPWRARGRFDAALEKGNVELTGQNIQATTAKVEQIPFIPPEVWDHVRPDGPVDVRLALGVDTKATTPLHVTTDVTYDGTTLDLPTLGLLAKDTQGTMTVIDGVVKLDHVHGEAIDGKVVADGTLNFTTTPARIDLNLDLNGVDVADTPEAWQLQELQLTGRLTGTAALRVVLEPDGGADLSGSSGEATIEGGSLGGIPVKSLKLTMSAEGTDLRYDTGAKAETARHLGLAGALLVALQETKAANSQAKTENPPPAPAETEQTPAEPKKPGGFRLPKSLSTEIELEDVDLQQVLSKVEAMGVHLPVAVAGKLSLKAKATIPLGQIRDIKAYIFHGEATLTGGHIAGVDLGRVEAKLDLENGVLALTDFRGQLVDRPAGDLIDHAAPTDPVPVEGPLPAGGFRGELKAALDPPGPLTAHFEGSALPLGELAAPALPKPTPLSGLVTVDAQAEADVARLAEPDAWKASATLQSEKITYRQTTLDAVSAKLALAEGRLDVSDLEATLSGQPLNGNVGINLAAPYDFKGQILVNGWDLSDALAFVPSVPQPSPIDGKLTADARAEGTLQPTKIATGGEGRIAQFQAGPVALGTVPFRWTTEGDTIQVKGVEAQPFGGRITAEAQIPTTGDRPIQGTAEFLGLDTSQMTGALPEGGLTMTGKANGHLTFLIRTDAPSDMPPLEANLQLKADELTVQGIAAQGLQAVLSLHKGVLRYDLLAESLGGKIKLKGDLPLATDDPPENAQPPPEANARLQAIGFTLGSLWNALNAGELLREFEGRGAIDANLRTTAQDPLGALRARYRRIPRPEVGTGHRPWQRERHRRPHACRLVDRPLDR